jgi:hypothetical protein
MLYTSDRGPLPGPYQRMLKYPVYDTVTYATYLVISKQPSG